jgi:hypothetical protein
MLLSNWIDWLKLRDYDEALEHARVAIVKRIARGNVSFQNGNIMDERCLDALRKEGDRSMAELIALLAVVDNARSGSDQRHSGKNPTRVGQS